MLRCVIKTNLLFFSMFCSRGGRCQRKKYRFFYAAYCEMKKLHYLCIAIEERLKGKQKWCGSSAG